MCVAMQGSSARTERVGVRELRQNLSVYLRRIRDGQRFEVTDRGLPVALLTPLRPHLSPLERLIAEGRVKRPVGDLLDLPPPEGPPTTALSDSVIADREDRF